MMFMGILPPIFPRALGFAEIYSWTPAFSADRKARRAANLNLHGSRPTPGPATHTEQTSCHCIGQMVYEVHGPAQRYGMRLRCLYETVAGDLVASVVCVTTNGSNQILLGKAAKNDYDDRDGKWCFCGGGIKNKELTVEQAAERELEEEAGIHGQADGVIQYGTPDGHVRRKIAFVLIRASGEPKPNHEFSEMRWMGPSEALELVDLYQPNRQIIQQLAAKFEDDQ